MKTSLGRAFLLTVLAVVLAGAAFAQPYGLNSRPNVAPFLNGAMPKSAPQVSGNWSAVVAFTNLTFLNAVGLAPMPGTAKLVVWEREGRVYHFDNTSGVAAQTLVLNITNQCQGWDDSGLLGLAFHPGFVTNRYMFVWYTWVTPGTVIGNQNQRPPTATPNRDRLSRFTLDANGVAIPGSETIFIDQNSGTVWHNGGGMFFGDDGFLYITNGDDANGANTQRINVSLHSGVLRIDVDRRGGGVSHAPPRQPNNGVTANYYIPNGNPFVGVANALEEFYCIGLRSPHRMTFDPISRRIFIGDVGEGSREEVSVIEPGERGLNFQWNRIEGLNGDLTPPYIGINKRPIIDYSHSEGFAVIGGYVYRGQQFAADLGGKYIFGDNGSKRIWVLDESTIPASKILLTTVPPGPGPNSGNDYVGLSSFGLDANGEIYMCQMSSTGGRIYKLQRGGPTNAPLPQLLSQTGAFTDTAALSPSATLIPYDVSSPLWSDGALKTRWMAIPTNQVITFSPTGEMTFPNGSVFVKHFELSLNETNPALRKRLETRLLVRDTNGAVYGATYKWRADNSDADLLDSSVTENVVITTASGTRTQAWYYPSRTDCIACHTTAARGVLGVKTRQSNREFLYPQSGVTDNQLRTWGHIGLFNNPPADADLAALARIVTVTNSAAPLETRVRSYLDANCSHCHRPGGVQAFWDGRFDTPLFSQGIINGTLANNLGISGAKVVVPANLAKSIMYARISSTETIKMPPLAHNVLDRPAVSAITEWITTLPPDFGSMTLVALGSNWKYLDTGTNLGTAWRAPGFNDSPWASGPAQLGYGDGDEATVVNGGPANNRYITTYFRHSFIATNTGAFTNLTVNLLRDDGGVVYLNGVEVFRSNMPQGPIDYLTPAASVALTPDESTTFYSADFSPGLLVEGVNVLAVEIHQANNTSSDISFELELTGFRNPSTNNTPPTVAISSPLNNTTLSAPATVLLSVTATDRETSVTNVAFFANGVKLGEDGSAPFSLAWNGVSAGAYQLHATASDSGGLSATSAVIHLTVSANNLPPAVALASPQSNAVFSALANITLAAVASDADGSVSRVEFYEGAHKLGEIAAAPYTFTWSNALAGGYSLSAVAYDNHAVPATSAIVPISVVASPVLFTNVLVSTGSVWRYLDNGSDQGTAWRAPSFDATGWSSGPAQLGYSSNPAENDEATILSFGPDPNNKFITTYFRHQFSISETGSYTNLDLRVLRDDGAVVYLNDVEVFRSNMPTGAVNYLTLASTAVTGAAETTQFFGTNVSPGLLGDGPNVLAVEIHQSGGTSSDISFDLELIGQGIRATDAPIVLSGDFVTPGVFRIQFNAVPGRSYIIEASVDLRSWLPVHTNTAVTSLVQFLDTADEPWRFYRARSSP